jgi:hypothetical protein
MLVNYMHNILPNINYRPGFVINKVVTLYVSATGGLSMSDEYISIKKQSITKNYAFEISEHFTQLQTQRIKLITETLKQTFNEKGYFLDNKFVH